MSNTPETNNRYVVIAPCRDEEEYMRLTLDSLVAQTLTPALCLVVDDGSTDKTPEILAEYEAKYDFSPETGSVPRALKKIGLTPEQIEEIGLDQDEIEAIETMTSGKSGEKFVSLIQQYLGITVPDEEEEEDQDASGGYRSEPASQKFRDRMRRGSSGGKFFREDSQIEEQLMKKLTPIIETMLRR